MRTFHPYLERRARLALALLLVSASVVVPVLATGQTNLLSSSRAAAVAYGPASPPAQVCSNASMLAGPSTAPAGAVTVPAGDNSNVTLDTPSTTYWFAPGTHTLGTTAFSQINPGSNDTYIGGPGAVIDGQNQNEFAFVASYHAPFDTGVTIEYLTIQHFVPPADGGAVNQNGGPGWTIDHDTIQDNLPGAAMMLGTNSTVKDNCLTENGQYAFNGYSTSETSSLTGGPMNITLSGNEISYNDTCNFEAVGNFPITPPAGCKGAGEFNGCGCSGGGKFWEVQNATITDNWVHDNYDVGLWADTNNDGLNFNGNYISDNYSIGLQYEVSYNALIQNNTFVGNGVQEGLAKPGFPTGAIYISESGGDPRAPNATGIQTITISNDTFTDNWDGVVLWENANRFCSNGLPTTQCTLVDPGVATVAGCAVALASSLLNLPSDSPDYFDLCRWKTQNVSVTSNQFNLTPSDLGSQCTVANNCGLNALFSEYGSTAPYGGAIVPTNITFNQGNVFRSNEYNGPWAFMAWSQGNEDFPISWAQWTAAVTDKCSTTQEKQSGTCDSGFGQDAGSTYNSSSPPPTTSATTSTTSPLTTAPSTTAPSTTTTSTTLPPSATTTTTTTTTSTTTAPSTATSAAGSSSTPPAGGVVEDKTFEGGRDNLAAWYGDSVATSTSAAHSGSSSLAVTATGGNWGVIENWPGQASVTPGSTYTFTAWVEAASAPGVITEEANWVGAGNATIGRATIATVRDSSGGWTELTGTATAPSGASHVALDFTSRSIPPGAVHYLDDVAVS